MMRAKHSRIKQLLKQNPEWTYKHREHKGQVDKLNTRPH